MVGEVFHEIDLCDYVGVLILVRFQLFGSYHLVDSVLSEGGELGDLEGRHDLGSVAKYAFELFNSFFSCFHFRFILFFYFWQTRIGFTYFVC